MPFGPLEPQATRLLKEGARWVTWGLQQHTNGLDPPMVLAHGSIG
jgi:hypothetical protein